jgi:N-carbamoylputrescine amidase
VYAEASNRARLVDGLQRARDQGADLVVLPELPLNPWSPAFEDARAEDAEPPDGARQEAMAQAARAAGVALLGGVIMLEHGRRHNTAVLYDRQGTTVARYRKLHLPQEPGFWEANHYEPGDDPPRVVQLPGFEDVPLGLQLCSDVNRPEGSHLLGAQGAVAILAPRATEAGTWERWKLVLRANAMTSATWVLSVTRPRPEFEVPLGGPSVVIAPDGSVVAETTEELCIADVTLETVAAARRDYPGYLAVRPDVYAAGWSAAATLASR